MGNSVDVILGAGMEGYGVVKFAFDFCKMLKQNAYASCVREFEELKYSHFGMIDAKDVSFSDHKTSDIAFVFSIPYETASEETKQSFLAALKDYEKVVYMMRSRNTREHNEKVAKLGFKEFYSLVDVVYTFPENDMLKLYIGDKAEVKFDDMLMINAFDYAHLRNGLKSNVAVFIGRPSLYKWPDLANRMFGTYFMPYGWSYMHLAGMNSLFVQDCLWSASCGFYFSEYNRLPAVENSVLELIASGVMPVTTADIAKRLTGKSKPEGFVLIEDLKQDSIKNLQYTPPSLDTLDKYSYDAFFSRISPELI